LRRRVLLLRFEVGGPPLESFRYVHELKAARIVPREFLCQPHARFGPVSEILCIHDASTCACKWSKITAESECGCSRFESKRGHLHLNQKGATFKCKRDQWGWKGPVLPRACTAGSRVCAARTGRLSLARSRGYGVKPANYSFLFKQWSRRRFQASDRRRDFQQTFPACTVDSLAMGTILKRCSFVLRIGVFHVPACELACRAASTNCRELAARGRPRSATRRNTSRTGGPRLKFLSLEINYYRPVNR
jgi:hypothetical protein